MAPMVELTMVIMFHRIIRAATFLALAMALMLSHDAYTMEDIGSSCGGSGMGNGGSGSGMLAIGDGDLRELPVLFGGTLPVDVEGYTMEDDAENIFMDQHRSNMQVSFLIYVGVISYNTHQYYSYK
jgi:hypothetical protein